MVALKKMLNGKCSPDSGKTTTGETILTVEDHMRICEIERLKGEARSHETISTLFAERDKKFDARFTDIKLEMNSHYGAILTAIKDLKQ